VDTPLSESRFSKVFDGWVDEHRDEHDAHDVHEPSGEALDDHDEHDDHDDHEEEGKLSHTRLKVHSLKISKPLFRRRTPF